MNNTPTPKTDAFAFNEDRRCSESGALMAPGDTEWLEFSRNLEIENQKLRESIGIYGDKKAPVQGFREGIPWDMHLKAYEAYCKKYSEQKALIEGWCRGGFHESELDMFIPGWRDELNKRKEKAFQLIESK